MENGFAFKLSVRLWYMFYTIIAFITIKNKLWQTKIGRFGEIAQWTRFIENEFKIQPTLFVNKDKLRLQAINQIKNRNEKVIVLEFGVAYGLGSKWLINQLSQSLLKFYGFDRFTGLPRKWRGLESGHFSTNGVHPEIGDKRVNWYVGDAEKTILDFENDFLKLMPHKRDYSLFVLFDMDILEPTQACYNILKKYLRKGDFIHFDEGFDLQNEGKVIKEFNSSFNSKVLGITSEAMLLEIL